MIKKIKFENKSKIFFKKEEKNIIKKKIFLLKSTFRKIFSIVKNKIILKSFLIQLLPEKYIYGKKMGLLKFDSISKKEIVNFFMKIEKKKINVINTSKISESVFYLYKK